MESIVPQKVTTDSPSPTSPKTEKSGHKPLVLVTLIIVLMLTSIVGAYVAISKILTLSNANEELTRSNSLLVSRNEELVKQNEKLNLDFEELKKTYEDTKSENTNTQGSIQKIDVNHTWKDISFDFELVSVYRTKDIIDLGALKDAAEIKDKEFIMVEIKVTDTRTEGAQRAVSQNNYTKLKVADQTEILSPSLNSVKYLNPKESGFVYTTFAVNTDTYEGILQIGPSGNTKNISLDFTSSTTQTLDGTISFKEGFKSG